ncbi:MAG TPA: hypothetical protein VJ736_10855 [Actinomycetota bacterium]|nr:hypothetical protein [Actinomycetota bacterium]
MCEMLVAGKGDVGWLGETTLARKVKVWKVIASVVCWTLSVLSALLAGAVFASGSVLCRGDRPDACTPQTWALVVGVILAVAFGAAGASLHKPRSSKPQSRFPWEYRG